MRRTGTDFSGFEHRWGPTYSKFQSKVTYGGGTGEYSRMDIQIQVKDARGKIQVVKIKSAGELEHVKRAINRARNDQSAREDFDIESIL